MRKNAVIGNALVEIILVVLLVFIFSGTILVSISKGASHIASCQGNGGECLPAGTPDRLNMGGTAGPFLDCEKAARESKQDLACFWKEDLQGSSSPIGEGVALVDGANLQMAVYAGKNVQYAGSLPFSKNEVLPGDIVERRQVGGGSTPIAAPEVQVYPGRLYAFQGVIVKEDATYCSIYIRKGEFREGTSNMYGAAAMGKCNDVNAPSAILYYVPRESDADLQLVMVKKKSLEEHYAPDRVIVAPIRVLSTPDIQYNNFKGGGRTDVSSLESQAYAGRKPVSFILETDKVKIEFKNVVLEESRGLNFNFDGIISVDAEGVLTIDGKKLSYLPSGKVAQITLKGARWKTPPIPRLGVLKVDDAIYKQCDSDICERVDFLVNGDVSFNADVANRFLRFKVFPAACKGLSKSECVAVPRGLMGFKCDWVAEACVDCAAKSCGDYDDKDFCLADTCSVGLVEGVTSCTWGKKWLWPDGCVDCTKKTKCSDYNLQETCEGQASACGVANCHWSKEKSVCVDCKAVASCSDYDKIKRDDKFCKENVCSSLSVPSCERKGGACKPASPLS